MKKNLLAVMTSLMLLAGVLKAAEPVIVNPTFWGKISEVDVSKKILTVYNRKKKIDMSFAWNDTTQMSNQKLPMKADELQVGQFLKVEYVTQNDKNIAQLIAVRPEPFKKKTAVK